MSGENLDESSDTGSDLSSHESADASPSGDEGPSSRSAMNGRVVVKAGAAIMVLASLLSWLDTGIDGFPHITGIGTTFGTGLAVFVLGLSLLLWDWPIGVTIGKALGALSVTAVFFSLVRPSSGYLGPGAWISLMGAGIALVGAVVVAVKSVDQAKLETTNLFRAGLGAVLAVLASVMFDWVPLTGLRLDSAGVDGAPLTGVDPDVSYGIPVLIFALVALILVAVANPDSSTNNRLVLLLIQVAGVSIAVVAGANVLGNMTFGWSVFGSGPYVALAGGILLTSSVRESDS